MIFQDQITADLLRVVEDEEWRIIWVIVGISVGGLASPFKACPLNAWSILVILDELLCLHFTMSARLLRL
jgi:hypothetical protein